MKSEDQVHLAADDGSQGPVPTCERLEQIERALLLGWQMFSAMCEGDDYSKDREKARDRMGEALNVCRALLDSAAPAVEIQRGTV